MLHEFQHNANLVLNYNKLDYSSKSKQAKQLDLHIYLDSRKKILGVKQRLSLITGLCQL